MIASIRSSQSRVVERTTVLSSVRELCGELPAEGLVLGGIDRGTAGKPLSNGDPPSMMLWGNDDMEEICLPGRFGGAME